jgi:hypothetical protein
MKPATVLDAVKLIKTGEVIELGQPLDRHDHSVRYRDIRNGSAFRQSRVLYDEIYDRTPSITSTDRFVPAAVRSACVFKGRPDRRSGPVANRPRRFNAPVPPVLSGRDQAPPTPFNDIAAGSLSQNEVIPNNGSS